MKVQSTGLGNTLMVAHFEDLSKTDFEKKQVLQVTMEAVEPLHWTIKVYMGAKDVRKAIFLGLKPSLVWKILLAFVFGRFSLLSKTEPEDKAEPMPAVGTPPATASSPLNALKGDDPLAGLKG